VKPPAPSIVSLATQYALDTSHGPAGRLEVVLYFKVPQPALTQPPVYYFQAEFTYAPEDGTEIQGPWRRIANIPADQRAAFFPADLGTIYDFRIRSVSAQGGVSAWDTYDDYTASVTSWVGVNVTGLQVVGGGTAWTGRDCLIEWTATTHSRARGYKIVVANTATSAVLREEYIEGVSNTQYAYTYSMNYEDTGGGPIRSITFYAYVYDNFGTLSSSDPGDLATLVATNAAPSMDGLSPELTPTANGMFADWSSIAPSDPDLIGYVVYGGTAYGDVAGLAAGAIVARLDASTEQWLVSNLTPDDDYYLRVLPYDAFGAGTASAIVSDQPRALSSTEVIPALANSIIISDSEGNEFYPAD
jgi:hypothetical protein